MPATTEADDLDLPPLDGALGGDGEDEHAPIGSDEEIDEHATKDSGDAFDDATAETDPHEDLAGGEEEAGWLVDAEDCRTLDVGPFDISAFGEGKILEDDEPEPHATYDGLIATDEAVHADGGEEGPLADDEELREEDLPALDADEDGDVADESLYEDASLGTTDELLWDDRAWARAEVAAGAEPARDGGDPAEGLLDPPTSNPLEDSEAFDDPRHQARDLAVSTIEKAHRVTASTILPGESIVLAVEGPERPLLVRILPDGVARIIAEIDTSGVDEGVKEVPVTALRWDAGRGYLLATGPFGAQAFRPA